MATAAAPATTPPPRGRVHTPPTPLHGARYDSYEPYSPRRSSRVAAQREKGKLLATTPKPHIGVGTSTPSSSSRLFNQKYSHTRNSSQTFSPPSSPTSPLKQLSPTRPSGFRNGRKKYPDLSVAGADSDSDAPGPSHTLHNSTLSESSTMLPTPSKTPRKRTEASHAAVSSTARVLFPPRPAAIEDVMPSPRKSRKSKKNSALTLQSFLDEGDEDEADKIEIYTDSKERVPTLDEDEDNPFVTPKKNGAPRDVAKVSRKGRGTKAGNKEENKKILDMDEKVAKDEGMIYVFRGRKIFRKFDDGEDSGGQASADEGPESLSEAETRRRAGKAAGHRFLRSTIKPRLLFPSEDQKRAREIAEEEEALTEIEEPSKAGPTITSDNVEAQTVQIVTPVKAEFHPATPPPTNRATRSTAKRSAPENDEQGEEDFEVDQLNAAAPKPKKTSPFDSWRRTKAGNLAVPKGTKREGEHIEREDGEPGKRTRSGNYTGS